MIDDCDDYPTDYSTGSVVFLPLATGTPAVGLWCETCMLPSRVEASVYALGPDGPTEIGISSRCMEHQR